MKHASVPALNQYYVILKFIGVTSAQFAQSYEWSGGVADTTEANKRKVSRTATGNGATIVNVYLKGTSTPVCQPMYVWVVWADTPTRTKTQAVTESHVNVPLADPFSKMWVEWSFSSTVKPQAIFDTLEVPKLNGTPPAVKTPNWDKSHYLTGPGDTVGNAKYCWELTAQVRERDLVPTLSTANLYIGAQAPIAGTLPNANKIQNTSVSTGTDGYPTDELEGNDDPTADPDPYAATPPGKLDETDQPSVSVNDTAGTVGDKFEIRFQWRMFVRAQLGSKWYRISDYGHWRFHAKMKKASEVTDNHDYNGDDDKLDTTWTKDTGTVSDDTDTDWNAAP